jgi:hypothetical protein
MTSKFKFDRQHFEETVDKLIRKGEVVEIDGVLHLTDKGRLRLKAIENAEMKSSLPKRVIN